MVFLVNNVYFLFLANYSFARSSFQISNQHICFRNYILYYMHYLFLLSVFHEFLNPYHAIIRIDLDINILASYSIHQPNFRVFILQKLRIRSIIV